MVKACRQCGREGEEETMFRRYVKRGNSVRKTSVGYHTICRDCENFNNNALNTYNKGPDKWTTADKNIIALAKSIYEAEFAKNLHPTGKLALILLGDKLKNRRDFSKSTRNNAIALANSLGITTEKVRHNVEELFDCTINESAEICQAYTMDTLIEQSGSINYIKELQNLTKSLEDDTFVGDATDADFKFDELKEKYKDVKPTAGTDYIETKYAKANEDFAVRHMDKK